MQQCVFHRRCSILVRVVCALPIKQDLLLHTETQEIDRKVSSKGISFGHRRCGPKPVHLPISTGDASGPGWHPQHPGIDRSVMFSYFLSRAMPHPRYWCILLCWPLPACTPFVPAAALLHRYVLLGPAMGKIFVFLPSVHTAWSSSAGGTRGHLFSFVPSIT